MKVLIACEERRILLGDSLRNYECFKALITAAQEAMNDHLLMGHKID
jgi:hypothetical protein